MIVDKYKEIKSKTKGFYKEKGSKFISYAFPVYSEEQIKKNLLHIKKAEHAARHFCYAYVLNTDKSIQRTNDDGEPSSTAGKPILGQILSNDLTNILIIVTRYFGGVKLGASGLINAYKTASADAISQANIIKKTIKVEYEVIFKYDKINDVMRIIKEYRLDIIYKNFNTESKIIFGVSKNNIDAVLKTFKKDHTLIINPIKKSNAIT